MSGADHMTGNHPHNAIEDLIPVVQIIIHHHQGVGGIQGQFRLDIGAIEEGPTPELLLALGVEAELL